MFCSQCGGAIQPGQKFCSVCGRSIGLAPAPGAQNRVAGNIKVLAILWMVIAAFRLLPGLFLMTLGRPSFFPEDVPLFVPGLLQGIGLFLCGVAAIGLLAGWGLWERQPWARMLAIVLGVISLIEVPFGTALGIYTLWVLLPAQSEAEYRQLSLSDPVR